MKQDTPHYRSGEGQPAQNRQHRRWRVRISHLLTACLLAWLLAVAALALAIVTMSSANAALISTETPSATIPSCAVLSGMERVDFGRLSRGQLKDVPGGMSVGRRTLTVSLVCNVAQSLKLRVSGFALGPQFVFGADGLLQVSVIRAQLDGKPVSLQRMTGGGNVMNQTSLPLTLHPEDVIAPEVNGMAVNGRHLDVTLQLEPVLGPRTSRPTQQRESALSLRFSREP